MEMLTVIFLSVMVWNTICCAAMYAVQQWEVKRGDVQERGTLIPGTNQTFLHWQDFYCQMYGCMIGLPLIATGALHLMYYGHVDSIAQWIAFALIIPVDAILFTMMCLGNKHKPDWGFPEVGNPSVGGLFHSCYHGVIVSFAVICIWHIILGNLRGEVMWLVVVGGVIYVISFLVDIRAGHFKKIKLEA